MSDLFWPGDERAGDTMSEAELLGSMVRVESAWLTVLVEAGVAPRSADADLTGPAGPVDVDDADTRAELARRAEASGNPVVPLVALLRQRLEDPNPAAARWLHRGLTSQDVLDTALALCAREAAALVDADLRAQVAALCRLAERHRDDAMVARTLTQHAVPTTFGLKAAGWLRGVLDASEDLAAAAAGLPAQCGGAAGTLSAVTELCSRTGLADPPEEATRMASSLAGSLGLAAPDSPWHTSRAPLTRLGDALVRCADAWGPVANDVATLSRPEIAELREPVADGRGGSSTMPQKVNPVLSVLVRRAALEAPGLGAQLHRAAAGTADERPAGEWQLEWGSLRTLARHVVTAGSHTTLLLEGLTVDTERMRGTLDGALPGVLAEQRAVADLAGGPAPGGDPAAYLGAAHLLVQAVVRRGRAHLRDRGGSEHLGGGA